ncbi:MAG: PGF-CTERM-anchored ABC transporter substrate-binding protein [Halobacteriota archaeon]
MPNSGHQTVLVAMALVVGMVSVASGVGPAGAMAHDEVTCDFPVEVTDATGETIRIEGEPQTVVTLAPSAAQTMWEIGAADKVVGVSMHAWFLEGTDDRVNVSADPMSTDIETVVGLEPDLVLAPNVTPTEEVEELRRLGVTVYHANVSTDIDDVARKTMRIGQLTGECEGASATVDDMEQRLERIEQRLEGVDDRPTVYYPSGDGFTPGAGTFQTVALEAAGLSNIAVEADVVGWDIMSEEVVVEHDPDWIVYPDSFEEPPIGEGARQTTAWEEEQVVAVDAQAISQPAPRIVDAIEAIHVAVYGELETPTPTPTPTPRATPTPAEPTPTPTTEQGAGADAIPGFSLAVGLVAILGLALLALRSRRR